jgi:hypothetical protein
MMPVPGVLKVRVLVEVAASFPASPLVFVAVAVTVDVAVVASFPASRTIGVPVAVIVTVAVLTSIPASRAVVVPVEVETPPSGLGGWQVTPIHARVAPHRLPAQHGWPEAPQGTQLPAEQVVPMPRQVLPAQQT